LLGIAAIAVKQGDIESAKSIYKELVQLDPRDPIAVAALSNLEKRTLGELGETKLKLMIRKNSEPSHLYFALGNIYSRQSRWPEAQQSYFNAWQSDTNNADYAFNLAVSLDQMGKQKEAIKFYKTSLANAKSGNTQFSIEVAESRLQQLSDGQK
jgi:tetratricopeptide (TPR) repeat protein